MNVLLITFSFPPAGGVGVLRALSLARYLPEHGVRVDVLTARNAPAVGRDDSLLAQVPAAVTVYRTWTLDLPFALRKFLKKRLAGRPVAAPVASSTPGSLAKQNPLKRLIANLLLPDPQVGWLPFALPAARRLVRQRDIDLVLVTVPPFSSARLITRLRDAFPALPLVLDFRDEWLTTTLELVSFNSNERARGVAGETEAAAVHAATVVVCVTEAAARELRSRYPEQPAEKFVCIPNGFDTPYPPPTPVSPPAPPVVLTYLGSIYGSTDPRTFVSAVSLLPPDLRAQLRVRFIGRVETAEYRDALLSLGDTVELMGFLPQAEALAAARDAHFLLLLTRDPINVSAKFYDYLGSGKPILAAIHPEGEVRERLEQTRAGAWADIHSPSAIADMLTQAIKATLAGQSGFAPDTAAIAGFHRRPLAARYAAVLTGLAVSSEAPLPGAKPFGDLR